MSSPLPPPVPVDPSASIRRPKIDAILMAGLFAGVLLVLIGATITADLLVATTTHQAEVTDKDRAAKVKDGVRTYRYSIRGVDDEGGTFRIGVGEDEYDAVDVGDAVAIERSVLTGRVVSAEGRGWSKERSTTRLLIAAGVGVLGMAVLVLSARAVRREVRAGHEQGEPIADARMRVVAMVLAAVLVTIVWLLIERIVAS
jgi:hypothetical protein